MIYTPLLFLTSALVAATGFSFQGSPSYDSLLSALSPIPDQDTVEEQPGYMSALQPDFQVLVGARSLSSYKGTTLRSPGVSSACCGKALIREFPMEIISTYTECHPDRMKGGEKYISMCKSLQCFAKKKRLVDAEGYVLPDKFVKAVSNWYTEDSLKTLAKRLAPLCTTQANAYAKEQLAASGSGEKCNLAPLATSSCVQYNIIAVCPEDLQVKSDTCDRMREQFKQTDRE